MTQQDRPGATGSPWPAAPPYAPAPSVPPSGRRRRSRWLTVGLPVGVLLLALLGTAIGFGVHALAGSLGPARQAADGYAAALVDGRWDDAAARVCTQDRSSVTSAALAQHYGSAGLSRSRVERIVVNSSNGRTSGEATIVLTTADGLDDQVVLPLAREHGEWRPCP